MLIALEMKYECLLCIQVSTCIVQGPDSGCNVAVIVMKRWPADTV